MHPNDTKRCFINHMGVWIIDPNWMRGAVRSVASGTYPETKVEALGATSSSVSLAVQDGIAIVAIEGPMMKG